MDHKKNKVRNVPFRSCVADDDDDESLGDGGYGDVNESDSIEKQTFFLFARMITKK
jgi:hypothetical protein